MRNSTVVLVMAIGFYAIVGLRLIGVDWILYVYYLSTRVTRRITGGPAPLWCFGGNENKVKDTYEITLNGGHTFEEHKSRIGRAEDLQEALSGGLHYHYDPVFGNQTDYELVTKDMTLLNAVRSDYDVLMVACDYYMNIRPLEKPTGPIIHDPQFSEPYTWKESEG